jgi:SAM-dependent methyltransferase
VTATTTPEELVDPEAAARWVDAWELQQERYAVRREERFAVVADVVAAVAGNRAVPRVVDLGCGPGSLAARVVRRLPRAEVLGLDADTLLLALGRVTTPEVTFHEATVGVPGWTDLLGGPVDAAVSSTALHYLDPERLGQVYRDLAAVVRPGGVVVNADHLPGEDAVLDVLQREVAARIPGPPTTTSLDWGSWWAGLAADPAMAPLLTRRRARPTVSGDHAVPVSTHHRLLREAGFRRSGEVWRYGPSVVIVAVR